METDNGGLTRPTPGHRSRLANLGLAEPARHRLIFHSPALSAGQLLTPSISLDNRFLTTSSGSCTTSLAVSSTLPLHFSQSLSPKLPQTLCPLTSLQWTICPLTSSSLKNKVVSPSPSAESDRQSRAPTMAPFSTGQWAAEDLTEVTVLMPSYNLSAQEYEDLEQARGALVAEELCDVPEPSQNQDVKLREKKETLLNGVCCSLIEGANFTDTQNPTCLHLLSLCQEIADQDPEFILKVALYTRQELNIRSTANFLLALSARLPPCRPHLRRYFCRAVRLPSDWTEVPRIYQSLMESSRKVAPYPSCLRQALADSFKLFDEYQLAKYNTRKQRCKAGLRRQRRIQKLPPDSVITKWSDYLSIAKSDTHLVAESSPALKEDKAKVIDQFCLKKLIRWLHLKEPAYHIMCLLGRRYPSDLQSFARSRLPGQWDSCRAGKRMKLQVPETWERQLSLHGSTRKGWEELIDHQKLPFMAMLRNLRNMIVAGMGRRHHEQNLKRLTDRNSVIHSRQFPFRFLSAYKVIAELQERLEQKDNPLPTKQALVQQALESIRLPKGRSRFLKVRGWSPARHNRVECVSFIYRLVTTKLEELEKRRDILYDQDLLEMYRGALDMAIEISATHNVPRLPGRTVVLCYVDQSMNEPCLSAKGLYVPRAGTQGGQGETKGPKMLEVAVLLGLMVKHVSEHYRLVLYTNTSHLELDVGSGSILGNVGQVLQEAKKLQDAARSKALGGCGMSSFLLDCVQDNVQIDTILLLGYYYLYTFSNALQLYRYHVNLELLFVHVDLSATRPSARSSTFGCKNDVLLSGYSDQILRFLCERGASRLLDHVDRIDDVFHLPRASESRRRQRVVEPTVLSPLLQTPKLRWRTVRVFVSSTFRDMQAERDLLTRCVFPELRARAARHFVWVQEVDLRWGITEEESRGNRQLELCLSEVSRCQLFVGILGERYGQILQEYSLPNLPQFEWVKSYPRGRSITELEIVQFLQQKNDCSSETSFFYTRDPAILRSLPEQWMSDFAAESEEGKTRMADLKNQVKEAGLLALENYGSEWGGEAHGRPCLKGLEEFGTSIFSSLWKAIVSQHCQAECGLEARLAADEDALQDGFLEAQSCRQYGRVQQLAAATSAIRERRQGGIFIVHGRPSEGKTAFMASLVTKLGISDMEKCPGPSDLLFHFTAASERAQDGTSMLYRLCVLLNNRLKRQQEVPRSYRGLVLEFHSLLDHVAHSQQRRHLVLVIDGADCVQTERGQRTSDWIPEHVPRGVTLVLSVTEDSLLHCVLAKSKGAVTIRLGPLEPLDRSEVVRRSLAIYGKKLEESAFNNQMRLLVIKKESHNPLFLKLASEVLREFGVFEKISEQIRALPTTLRLLIQHTLGCLEEQHGTGMVTFALSALSASGKGLRERDLYSILCTSSGLRTGSPPPQWEEVMQETLKPSRPVPMATFAGLLRSLRW
uniref:telomerase protein component 1-like n=1 Tax=Pristiophorus japonicus TaxID=55135 RepID=UPI00398E90D5